MENFNQAAAQGTQQGQEFLTKRGIDFGTDAFWYLPGHGHYKDAQLVTDDCCNPAIGVEYIHLMEVKSTKANAPICQFALNLAYGVVFYGQIFSSQNNAGALVFHVNQPTYTATNPQTNVAETRYERVFTLPAAIRAQVMRHVNKRIVTMQVPMGQSFISNGAAPQGVPAQQGAPAQQFQQQQAPMTQTESVPFGNTTVDVQSSIPDFMNSRQENLQSAFADMNA